MKLKRTQASKEERYGQIMTTVIDVTEGNTLSYGRKFQRNLTHSGRNQKRLPGGMIIRISPDDHYKKPNKKEQKTMTRTENSTAWHITECKTCPG